MLISTSKRFIFVANTKTASTAIEHVLAPHAEHQLGGTPKQKHLPLSAVESTMPQVFSAPANTLDWFFTFGVMRDPIDWIVSWYRYRRGNKVQSPIPADMSFDAFWQRCDWNIRRKTGQKFLQSPMFLGPDGACLADVIIPYDQMATCAAPIFAALGTPGTVPRKNVSLVRDPGEPLSPALRDEMRAYYAEDYALLDSLDRINAQGMDKLHAMTAR